MLFRTFTANTTAEAMGQVRAALGPDAVIVATRNAAGGGVELIAAAERLAAPEPAETAPEAPSPEPAQDSGAAVPLRRARPRAGRVAGWENRDSGEALAYHGVPQKLADDLIRLSASLNPEDRVCGLAAALEARFRFIPVPAAPALPVALVGPSGVGKTVTAAKLGSRAALAGHAVELLTTDIARAGAREQLGHFAELLDCPLVPVPDPDRLRAMLSGPGQRVRILDTAGINPLDSGDLADLRGLTRLADLDVALVLAAGIDPREAAEVAECFVRIGARRLIATRIDASRRLGSLLAAADAGLAFAQIGITPYVARGLTPLDPMSLARLLLEDPAERPCFDTLHEAAE